ncbi:3-dehydroquinate synthase [candidate division KSB1 bacterium]|nr:3-dehydroquinate synthase [candidate division KSB1 bacterium]
MNKLLVELGENSYPIFIGENILENLGEMLKLYNFSRQVVVITDSNVNKHHGKALAKGLSSSLKSFELITIPSGEKSKSFRTIENIVTQMLELGCDRQTAILAFGGGVVGDITGFVASIYKRGVPYLQIPTTLLAQVDSSVGGKTGVNHPLGKNMVGTFYQPKMVWTDLKLLRTLPKKEIVCGLGEIIKYGIIKDGELFELVAENLEKILALDLELLQGIVMKCCRIKAEIVAEDEKENGLRMILNFGHTIGHALEAEIGYKKISHGEAVLLGMLAESKIALSLKMLNKEDFLRIEGLIAKFNLSDKLKNIDSKRLLQFIGSDKKAASGRIRFVLPRKIGEVEIVEDIESSVIKSAMKYVFSF